MDRTQSGLSPLKADEAADEKDFNVLKLWRSRGTSPSDLPLLSFAWMPINNLVDTGSSPVTYNLITANRDNIVSMTLPEPHKFAWSPHGSLLVTGGRGMDIYLPENNFDRSRSPSTREIFSPASLVSRDRRISGDDSGGLMNSSPVLERTRQISTEDTTKNAVDTRIFSTPATTMASPRRRNMVEFLEPRGEDSQNLTRAFGRIGLSLSQRKGAKEHVRSIHDHQLKHLLQQDISVVMRDRAKAGYAMNCDLNLDIIKDDPKLLEFWTWIQRAEKLSAEGKSLIEKVDFSFHGVYSIWQGTSTSSGSKKSSPVSTPRPSPPPSNSSQSASPASAKVDREIFITASTKAAQRRLALRITGFDNDKIALDEHLQSMEQANQSNKAAGWALFHGDVHRALRLLNSSQDERHRLMAAALAGYANFVSGSETDSSHSLWKELLTSLMNELSDPYLFAIFSYITTSTWQKVLEQNNLPLKDRLGIALRFLDDEALGKYLNEVFAQYTSSGDLEGIQVTGLSPHGVKLLANYVNRTGDIQTACLGTSFVVPRRFRDSRVDEWVENYRLLLNRWQYYHSRAKLDIARGKHMGANTAARSTITQPQVFVHCHYCNQSIAHSFVIPVGRGKGSNRPLTVAAAASAGAIAGTQKVRWFHLPND
ncbi:uncharacterized protein VTP21DRAFT_504 [Calcarisporiella thermophila]|uniref:uncharacterized protein n=1 Tax=Calcarisporiella thermophila TaxID=911321 RepID=UPI003742F4FC